MVYEFRIPPYTKIIYLFKIKVYEFNIPFTKKVYEYRIPFESKRKPGRVPGIKPGFRVVKRSKLLLWQFSLPALIFACFVAIYRKNARRYQTGRLIKFTVSKALE